MDILLIPAAVVVISMMLIVVVIVVILVMLMVLVSMVMLFLFNANDVRGVCLWRLLFEFVAVIINYNSFMPC